MAAKTKRKVRRFAGGGSDSYDPDQDVADAQAARDAGSFAAAFRAARKDAGDTFMWRGKRYTKDMAKPKAAKADAAPARPAADIRKPVYGANWSGMQQPDTGAVESVAPESYVMGPGAIKGLAGLAGAGLTAAAARGLAPRALKALAGAESRAEAERQAANIMSRAAQKEAARQGAENSAEAIRAGLARAEAASGRRTKGFAERLRQEANRDRAANSPGIIDWRRAPSDADLSGVIGGYKKGGSVKKYAKGGSVRGGGIERKGKTKGRFV